MMRRPAKNNPLMTPVAISSESLSSATRTVAEAVSGTDVAEGASRMGGSILSARLPTSLLVDGLLRQGTEMLPVR